jgi:site-specific recombinase XerD
MKDEVMNMASVFKQQYTTKGKNGEKIKKRSAHWYIDYKSPDGTRKRVRGFKDKAATLQLAAKLEKESELAHAGIIDKFKEHRKRALSEHMEDFRHFLLAKGNTAKHAELTVSRAKRIMEECEFCLWDDIAGSKVQFCLSNIQSGEKAVGAQTSNYYLQSIKQFCHWMVQDGRASASPLEHLKKKKTEKAWQRALEPDEMRKLVQTTQTATERFRMPGEERAMLYLLASESGLRANELRSLTLASFDFENCTVMVESGSAKNRTMCTLPLKAKTAEMLKELFKLKTPQSKAFGLPSKYRMADMFRADLGTAGVDYSDDVESEDYVNFHSLRHTTGTLLAASGVHPKVAQSIMRHSDINLTMSRYTHVLSGQESRAVEALPDLMAPSQTSQQAKVTGTDNKKVGTAHKSAYKKLTKKVVSDSIQLSPFGRSDGLVGPESTAGEGASNPSDEADLDTNCLGVSPVGTPSQSNTPGRTRTCGLRIRNPLLYPTELQAHFDLKLGNITTCYVCCQSHHCVKRPKNSVCIVFFPRSLSENLPIQVPPIAMDDAGVNYAVLQIHRDQLGGPATGPGSSGF